MGWTEYTKPLLGAVNGVSELKVVLTKKGKVEIRPTAKLVRELGLDKQPKYRVFFDADAGCMGIAVDPTGKYTFASRSGNLRAFKQLLDELGCEIKESHSFAPKFPPKNSPGVPVIAFKITSILPRRNIGHPPADVS